MRAEADSNFYILRFKDDFGNSYASKSFEAADTIRFSVGQSLTKKNKLLMCIEGYTADGSDITQIHKSPIIQLTLEDSITGDFITASEDTESLTAYLTNAVNNKVDKPTTADEGKVLVTDSQGEAVWDDISNYVDVPDNVATTEQVDEKVNEAVSSVQSDIETTESRLQQKMADSFQAVADTWKEPL